MSKLPIKVAPLQHKGVTWIKISSPLTIQHQILVKEIKGRKWSNTHKCWYIPYTKEAYTELKSRFLIDNSKILAPEKSTLISSNSANSYTHIRLVYESDARIKAFVPYDKKDG